MTVRKINGFRAPYRSQTFREEVNLLVRRNGVLYMNGTVSQLGLTITIPAFAFVQQGLVVEVDTATTVSVPSMEAPYYLTVSSLSVSNVDDLRWQFAKSPLDLSNTEVIVASYDGLEWRLPQFVTFDGVYNDIDDSNVDFNLVGPFSGLFTSVDGSNYRNTAGKLVDQQGLRTRLEADALFPTIAADPDYSRVDKILYRRPNDSPYRIGVRKLLTGGAFDTTPSVLYNTGYLDSSKVRQNVKVLVASDNTAHIFTAVGYGTSFTLSYTKFSSDRQSELISDLPLFADMTDAGFDVAIDSTNHFHIVYTAGLQTKWRKFSSSGVSVLGPVRVDVQSTQCKNPTVSIDPANSAVFIAYQCLTGSGISQIFFRTVTLGGVLAVDNRSMAGALSNLVDPSIFVTDDLWVYLSWTDQSSGRVYYRVFDDIGGPLDSAATLVSSSTQKIGGGTLIDGAKKSKIIVTDNKKVVVGFLQDKGSSLFGLAIWVGGSAYMQTLVSGSDNFVAWDFEIEPIFNGINISVAQAARADYVRLEDAAVLYALQLSTSGVAQVSPVKDKLGALVHAWSRSQAGTYTNYGTNVSIRFIGPTVQGLVTIAPYQCAVAVADLLVTPKAGDKLTTNSIASPGPYFISDVSIVTIGANSCYLISFTSNFNGAETNKHGTFSAPDGNTSRFAKSVADTKATAYRYSTLDTDVLFSRIVSPGPIILNYVTHSGPSEIRKPYLVGGTNVVIDWSKTVVGELTIVGGLKLLNLLDNLVYSVADGSYAMAEGDAMFVVLDGVNMSPVPQIISRAMLPWGIPIQVLGVIEEGLFSPLLLSEEMTQLDPGESDTVGEDLPISLRQRLGITSETTYQPYTSTYVINSTDTYPEALSGLDARVEALETNHPDEEEFKGDGTTKIFTLTRFLVNTSNSIYDNQVWVSGRKQTQDPTGGLAKSYRKISTTRIEFVEAPRLNDSVTVRKEGTNYGGPIPPISGQLWSDAVDHDIAGVDLGFKVGGTSNRFSEGHFKKTSTERVEMPLPVGTVSLIKGMISGYVGNLLAGQPVSKYSDGKLYPADSDSVEGQSFVGVIAETTAFNVPGRVLLPGHNIPGALTGLGFAPGDDIYLSETGGGYTNNPGGYAGNNDSIVRVGVADCAEGVASAVATDLIMMTYVIARS